MVIAPGGEVLYQKEGKIDIIEVRRHILAAMPDTRGLHRVEGVLDGFAGGREEGTQVARPGCAWEPALVEELVLSVVEGPALSLSKAASASPRGKTTPPREGLR